jgi:hypothetical protein
MRSIAHPALCGLIPIVLVCGCSKGPTAAVPGATPVAGAEPGPVALPAPLAEAQKPLVIVPHVPIEQRWPAFHELGMKEVTIDTLARIGHDAVPALVQLLRESESPEMREQAVIALARMGPEAVAAVAPLIKALDDPDEVVRKNAIRALGQIGPAAAKAVPQLVDILKHLELNAEK